MDTKKHLLSGVRCQSSVATDDRSEGRRTTDHGRRTAFTLVELLVVITIIGILASLITVAAMGALKNARRTEVKAEVGQIDGGFNEVKNKLNAFPPNCQTDGTTGPIVEATVLADLKRFMKTAFPRHQEPDNVIAALVGLRADGTPIAAGQPMAGGMSAGEALVFWLGGFSQDPKYPISGEGGPSYAYGTAPDPRTVDPIESRKWIFPCKVDRLGPRAADGYFDQTTRHRYFAYTAPNGQKRRINFWQYMPRRSEQPYVYFDTSRYAPAAATDPPAATALTGLSGDTSTPVNIFAFKKNGPNGSREYINPDKFQVLHCGINDKWDFDTFSKRVSAAGIDYPSNALLYPDGPFVGDMAELIPNFTTETKLEDATK